jgi:RNA polymerase sigma-70 factor (ECF subfamily)
MATKTANINDFDLLYRRFFNRLFLFANTIVKDSAVAEDIVQDAFVTIWEDQKHLKKETIKSYLFTAVRNRCLNHQRHLLIKQKNLSDLSILSYYEELFRIDFIKDEPYVLFEKELKDRINSALSSVRPVCKEAFELSRLKGFKNREVAEQMGVSIKSVERYVAKALQVLKHHFGEDFYRIILMYSVFRGGLL